MRRLLHSLLVVILCLTTLLWLSSYSHHSSFGIDHDSVQQNEILHTFYRINWTGHGSLWIGYGSHWRQGDTKIPLEKFDLAATLFEPNNKPLQTNSFWNRLGFWFIYSQSPKPTFWVGIPSWLPVLVLVMIVLFQRRSIKSHDETLNAK